MVTGLQAAVSSGRIAHAYLFAGPRGTGKTSAARILAKCLNCLRGGPRPDPCGECEACVSIAAGTAFDVIEIDAASNRGINEIRELRERVKFAPAQFRYKVYIVDEVHMLTAEAFNALLKTLEEPPANVVFVLATTEPHKVPPTILSRCQRYEFRRMMPDDITERLADVAKREGITADTATLQRIAYLADGALRDALVLLEQARGFAKQDIVDEAVLDTAFGAPVFDIVDKAARAVGSSDVAAALAAIAEAVDRGADPGWLTKELLRWFRLALLAQVSPRVLATELPPEAAERMLKEAQPIPRNRLLSALRNLSEVIAQRYSAQPRIDLELALVRVLLPSDELSLQALSDRLRAIEERMQTSHSPHPTSNGGAPPSDAPPSRKSAPARGAAKTPAKRGANAEAAIAETAITEAAIVEAVFAGATETMPPPASPLPVAVAATASEPLSVAKLHALWPHIVNAVKDRSKPCFGQLEHATIISVNGGAVTLGVPSKFNRDLLGEPASLDIVADAIHEVSGLRPTISCVVAAPQERSANGERNAFSLAESVLGAELF